MITSRVRERPILFSGPMITAILDGRKTVTRRVVTPQPYKVEPPDDGCGWRWEFSRRGLAYAWNTNAPSLASGMQSHCPYGRPGDRLWVKESFALVRNWGEDGLEDYEGPIRDASLMSVQVWHKAGHPRESDTLEDRGFRWRPSIHMPRWASRITLEITGIRVERLHEISEADKIAEGATPEMPFGTVWRQINVTPGIRWEDNPWVWVIEFRRIDI